MMPLRIGARASCIDGACGQVSRIIVNPVTRQVTHLAVGPRHRPGSGRLVPVELVNATTGQLRLRCTLAEFQALRPAQEAQSVRDLDPTGHSHVANRANLFVWMHAARDRGDGSQQATVDYVPSGEIGIHRGLTVCATDGEIGQVQGLLVEPGGHQVTHVLLQKGRRPGRKEAAIPISAVAKIGTLLIRLSLTRGQVKDLPPVNVDHPAG